MSLTDQIFSIKTEEDFKATALKVFKFQFENNRIYRSFCDLLYVNPSDVKSIEDIPFLPIQFFKSHEVLACKNPIEATFTSSGTTGSITSKHLVTNISIYEESYLKAFNHFYGNIEDYAVLALLPNYLEREDSSLVYMANDLIEKSNNTHSGFYLNQYDALIEQLKHLESIGQKTLLIGVTFALLNLIEKQNFKLKHTIIMETGGMKGMRKELVREELHHVLTTGFGVKTIHSEYGMTELLSQAYSDGLGIFKCPNWMKVLTRDPEDALTITKGKKTGGLNIIDLANVNSCSFIATQDLGKAHDNGDFEVVGRFDASDIRGCNLMAL